MGGITCGHCAGRWPSLPGSSSRSRLVSRFGWRTIRFCGCVSASAPTARWCGRSRAMPCGARSWCASRRRSESGPDRVGTASLRGSAGKARDLRHRRRHEAHLQGREALLLVGGIALCGATVRWARLGAIDGRHQPHDRDVVAIAIERQLVVPARVRDQEARLDELTQNRFCRQPVRRIVLGDDDVSRADALDGARGQVGDDDIGVSGAISAPASLKLQGHASGRTDRS